MRNCWHLWRENILSDFFHVDSWKPVTIGPESRLCAAGLESLAIYNYRCVAYRNLSYHVFRDILYQASFLNASDPHVRDGRAEGQDMPTWYGELRQRSERCIWHPWDPNAHHVFVSFAKQRDCKGQQCVYGESPTFIYLSFSKSLLLSLS